MKKYFLHVCLLIVLACGFSSCEEEHYYDPWEELTYHLCDYVWSDSFFVDGLDCEQQLRFNLDGTGWDTRIFYYPNGSTEMFEDPFHWHWDNHYTDIIYIDYVDGHTIMEDVRLSGRRMHCLYDGEPIIFEGI